MKKFSGKRYFYWLGASDQRNDYWWRNDYVWPLWARRAYYMGQADQKLSDEATK